MYDKKAIAICETMIDGVMLGVNTVDHMELTESLQYDSLIESCDEMCRVLVESADKKKFDWRKILSSIKKFFSDIVNRVFKRGGIDRKTKEEGLSVFGKLRRLLRRKKKELPKSDPESAEAEKNFDRAEKEIDLNIEKLENIETEKVEEKKAEKEIDVDAELARIQAISDGSNIDNERKIMAEKERKAKVEEERKEKERKVKAEEERKVKAEKERLNIIKNKKMIASSLADKYGTKEQIDDIISKNRETYSPKLGTFTGKGGVVKIRSIDRVIGERPQYVIRIKSTNEIDYEVSIDGRLNTASSSDYHLIDHN